VASCYADRRERRDSYQHRINARSPTTGVVKGCNQEYDAQRRDGDSLEDTQRTGLETELVLRVKSIGQERDTRREAAEIEQTTIF
jgi:hypothetical protein